MPGFTLINLHITKEMSKCHTCLMYAVSFYSGRSQRNSKNSETIVQSEN